MDDDCYYKNKPVDVTPKPKRLNISTMNKRITPTPCVGEDVSLILDISSDKHIQKQFNDSFSKKHVWGMFLFCFVFFCVFFCGLRSLICLCVCMFFGVFLVNRFHNNSECDVINMYAILWDQFLVLIESVFFKKKKNKYKCCVYRTWIPTLTYDKFLDIIQRGGMNSLVFFFTCHSWDTNKDFCFVFLINVHSFWIYN